MKDNEKIENIFLNNKLILRKDIKNEKDFLLKSRFSLSKIAASFPKIVDFTKEMSSIKDQGSIGSCVAFAISAMKEWQESYENKEEIKNGKKDIRKGKEYDYSEYWIYKMCKKIDNWPNEEGTSIRDGMKVLNKIGVPCESAWKYEHMLDQEPKVWAPLIARWALIGEYYRINNVLELKTALQEGPVVAGVPCYTGFFTVGKNGVVPYPKENDKCYGGHAICLVGYNDNNQLIKFKNSWGCYDDKTELLTSNGFKYFKDLNTKDMIATLNKNGVIEYHKSSNYIEYLYSGDMYEFKNSKIDLLVTPNHNMYIQTLRNRQEKNTTFDFIKAENIKNKQIVFKRNSIWNGEEKEFFELPEIIKNLNTTKTVRIGKTKILMDTWLEFLGYWLSEGHVTKSKCKRGGHCYVIGISQSKKKNFKKIDECLKKLGFKFSYNRKCFVFQNQQLFTYLKQFGKCNKKYIPLELKILSIRQLKILYDALMLGDGSVVVGKNGSKKKTYYTTSKQLSDDFQELCLKLGYCSTISIDDRVGQKNKKGYNYNFIVYNVNIQNTQSFNSANTILNYNKSKNKKEYDGKVYCVEVPNHTLFVRRNGKTCWCGNSDWGQDGYGYISYNYFDDLSWDTWGCKDIQITKEMMKGASVLL